MSAPRPPEFTAATPQQLAQLLRAFRRGLKLSQRQAAAVAGLLPKTVSALETRTSASTIESLYRLLSALNVELVVRPKKPTGPKGSW